MQSSIMYEEFIVIVNGIKFVKRVGEGGNVFYTAPLPYIIYDNYNGEADTIELWYNRYEKSWVAMLRDDINGFQIKSSVYSYIKEDALAGLIIDNDIRF
jgi:hypothetical protein